METNSGGVECPLAQAVSSALVEARCLYLPVCSVSRWTQRKGDGWKKGRRKKKKRVRKKKDKRKEG